jgi:5-methylcytosine-specific restriction protein A
MPMKVKTFKQVHPSPEIRGSSFERGYGHRWQRNRKGFLQENPLCVQCLGEGRSVPATDVDHIKPHRGDEGIFWDVTNWQALCGFHHKQKTGRGQ